MTATLYRRPDTHRVRVAMFCLGSGEHFHVDYHVDEDTDGGPDGHAAAMQAEADHEGCYFDSWEHA